MDLVRVAPGTWLADPDPGDEPLSPIAGLLSDRDPNSDPLNFPPKH
jgi:hypothetical protein